MRACHSLTVAWPLICISHVRFRVEPNGWSPFSLWSQGGEGGAEAEPQMRSPFDVELMDDEDPPHFPRKIALINTTTGTAAARGEARTGGGERVQPGRFEVG